MTLILSTRERKSLKNMMWNFRKYQDNTAAITEEGREITYADIIDMSSLLSSFIPERCLIISLTSNQAGSLLGYVTFINNRLVPLLLNSVMDTDLLWPIIDTYKPDYLWLPSIIEGKFPMFEPVCSVCGYSLVKTPYSRVYPLHEELALLLTTSGSTGSFKMVRQSYSNIRANLEAITEYLGLDEIQRPITTLPMSYSYGLSVINSHLYVGASIILTSKTMVQREFWQQFKKHQATSLAGVPYTYEVLNRLNFCTMDLPSLETMTQAGGKLSVALHQKFGEFAHRTGRRFVVMYGQTEATARMSYLPHEKTLEKCGSIGIPIPGGKFSIVGTNGKVIDEPGITGELIYEGANVTLGYAVCGEDLIKADEFNGRLLTGDMAKRDADGFYYIVGRKKRILKIFGSSVSLDELEQLIKARFKGLECACTGIDDALGIFVTDKEVVNEIREYVAAKTGINRAALDVKCIDVIPKNEAGKILYGELPEDSQ